MTKSLEQYKNQIQNLQKKYDMLREDYQYNLKVVSERDNELKKCDNRISKLSTVDILNKMYQKQTISQMKATEGNYQKQKKNLNSVQNENENNNIAITKCIKSRK